VVALALCEARHRTRVAAVNRAYEVVPSPNHGPRPLLRFGRPDCVVLHATATESFAETVGILSDPRSGVSAHFLVGKNGRVVQLVPVERRAWHAGDSRLDGRADVNSRSVGVEIMNRNDGRDPYTDAQYRAVARIVQRLRTCYRIPDERIVSHAAVAVPPGRKSDPRGLDFERVRRLSR
jgi:N-acetyl-anhydromuramyl-L-alanine amidase AmpD